MAETPRFQRAERARPTRAPSRLSYITLYLRKATFEALKAVGCDRGDQRGGVTRAARIASICERYAALVEDAMPWLTEAQWCGLMAVLNPGIGDNEFAELNAKDNGLAERVRAAHAEGRGQEWDYDRGELERRLADLTQFTIFAVAEVSDRFWSSDFDDGRTPRQRLMDCGAQVIGVRRTLSRAP